MKLFNFLLNYGKVNSDQMTKLTVTSIEDKIEQFELSTGNVLKNRHHPERKNGNLEYEGNSRKFVEKSK